MRLDPDRRRRIEEWYLRRFLARAPRALLRALTLPAGRQLKTIEAFRYESARILRVAMALTTREGVAGDYLEFGVFRGHSFVEAWHAAEYYDRRSMRFLAFDSFAGLPEVASHDVGGPFAEGEFRAPRAEFEAALRLRRIPPDRVTIVEGYYEETLAPARRQSVPVEKAAIAFLDCDLYSSTVPVLEFLTDLLLDGSVLIFDDWYNFKGHPDQGQQRATAEWLVRNPDIRLVRFQMFSWSGQSFIVNRSDRTAASGWRGRGSS